MYLTSESYTQVLEKVIDAAEINKNVIFMHKRSRRKVNIFQEIDQRIKQDTQSTTDYMGIEEKIEEKDQQIPQLSKMVLIEEKILEEKDQQILQLSKRVEELVEKNKILNKDQEALKKKIKQLEYDIEVMQI